MISKGRAIDMVARLTTPRGFRTVNIYPLPRGRIPGLAAVADIETDDASGISAS